MLVENEGRQRRWAMPTLRGWKKLSDAGMKEAGTIFNIFTNNWWMPGFFLTTQAKRQHFLMKEKNDEQGQSTDSRY
jgi:hypothetical protein